jgi:hypothetical protein
MSWNNVIPWQIWAKMLAWDQAAEACMFVNEINAREFRTDWF